MKVTVKLSIDVDPDAWDEEHGTGTRAKDVVNDVRDVAASVLRTSPRIAVTGATVELSR